MTIWYTINSAIGEYSELIETTGIGGSRRYVNPRYAKVAVDSTSTIWTVTVNKNKLHYFPSRPGNRWKY